SARTGESANFRRSMMPFSAASQTMISPLLVPVTSRFPSGVKTTAGMCETIFAVSCARMKDEPRTTPVALALPGAGAGFGPDGAFCAGAGGPAVAFCGGFTAPGFRLGFSAAHDARIARAAAAAVDRNARAL